MKKGTRKARITELGELQLQILDILSDLGQGTVYQVLDGFPEPRRPHYSTVAAALRRLEHKGLVQHRTAEHQYVFWPTSDPSEVRRGLLREVLKRVFGGSRRQLVRTLLEMEDMTAESLEEIKAEVAVWEADTNVD